MAVIKNTLIAAAVLASGALAVPVAGLDARAIVVETVTQTDWVTLNVTATVYVNDANPSQVPVTVIPTPTVALVTSSSSSSPAPVAASSAPTTSASVPSVSPAGFAAEQPSDTPAAPATFTTSTASAPSSTGLLTQKDTTASTSGTCLGQANACVGDVTHWDGGLGACGWNVNTASDLSIALPVGFMGAQSNGNPYCGRSVTLLNPKTGTTVKATVGDKCMGCVDRAIDLTNILFNQIVPGGDGRVSGIEWWLN